MKFDCKDPHKAYITNNLLLPKSGVVVQPIKSALTFVHGEENEINELGELVSTKPKKLRLWDETKHHLVVPREFIPPERYRDYDFEFVDLIPEHFPSMEVKDRIVLRDDDQHDAYQALATNTCGTFNLACGHGKSVLALKLVAELGVPAIVVVNTSALLEQWKKEIRKHLYVDSVGTIQGKAHDWEHSIVVAMVQTLSQNREQWSMKFRRHFGLIIYDEGHHMSAPVFVRSADLFFGRRFSLTATASRLDGLESIYQYHLGRVIYSNLNQELIPHTVFRQLVWEFDEKDAHLVNDTFGQKNMSRIRVHLGTLDWRNDLIYEDVLSDIKEGRNLLILSHSVDHVDRMGAEMRYLGLKAGQITGKTPQAHRLSILEGCNPVLGTFQLAREGLDKPPLDTLYITTPFSSPNDVQQALGRIQRKYDGKKDPLARIYEDLAFSQCRSAGRSLRSTLKKRSYPYNIKKVEVYPWE